MTTRSPVHKQLHFEDILSTESSKKKEKSRIFNKNLAQLKYDLENFFEIQTKDTPKHQRNYFYEDKEREENGFRETDLSSEEETEQEELNKEVVQFLKKKMTMKTSDSSKVIDFDISTLLVQANAAARFFEDELYLKSLRIDDPLSEIIRQLKELGSENRVRFIIQTGIDISVGLKEKCARLLKALCDFEERRRVSKKSKILNIYLWVTDSDFKKGSGLGNLTDKIKDIKILLKEKISMKCREKMLLQSQSKLFSLLQKHFDNLKQHFLLFHIPSFYQVSFTDSLPPENLPADDKKMQNHEKKESVEEFLARYK